MIFFSLEKNEIFRIFHSLTRFWHLATATGQKLTKSGILPNIKKKRHKTVSGSQKSKKSHFFLRKKIWCKIVRFKSLKNLFFDPRPKKCPKNYFHAPRFLRYVGFQWLLKKHVLKIGHYLETRFSGNFERSTSRKKNRNLRNYDFF